MILLLSIGAAFLVARLQKARPGTLRTEEFREQESSLLDGARPRMPWRGR